MGFGIVITAIDDFDAVQLILRLQPGVFRVPDDQSVGRLRFPSRMIPEYECTLLARGGRSVLPGFGHERSRVSQKNGVQVAGWHLARDLRALDYNHIQIVTSATGNF